MDLIPSFKSILDIPSQVNKNATAQKPRLEIFINGHSVY